MRALQPPFLGAAVAAVAAGGDGVRATRLLLRVNSVAAAIYFCIAGSLGFERLIRSSHHSAIQFFLLPYVALAVLNVCTIVPLRRRLAKLSKTA